MTPQEIRDALGRIVAEVEQRKSADDPMEVYATLGYATGAIQGLMNRINGWDVFDDDGAA